MKTTTKTRIIKSLDVVQNLLEKCGGQGGTPGPCPSGNKPSGGGGSSASTALKAMPPGTKKKSNGVHEWSGSGDSASTDFYASFNSLLKQGFKPKGSSLAHGGMIRQEYGHKDGHRMLAISDSRNKTFQISLKLKD